MFQFFEKLPFKSPLQSIKLRDLDKPGADPGFLIRGFKWPKGGSFWYFYLDFHKNPHEIETILSKRGV